MRSDPKTDLRIDVLDDLGAVTAAAWDRLAPPDNPFLEHAFLRALETSRSVGDVRTGWIPRHVLAYRGATLVGAMPLYEKHDSYGEYIFDWSWAQAAARARIPYYPKLVSAVPFTPVTGPRALVAPEESAGEIRDALWRAARELADASGASGVHVLFCTAQEQEHLRAHGAMPRLSYQFHWENQPGWKTFDDYLGAMRSRARKQVNKERRQAASQVTRLAVLRGAELGEREWAALWDFYHHTTSNKWGRPYLTRAFFESLRTELAHRVVSALAYDGDEPVAGTLMFHKGDQLFGRYWGARRELKDLHFELCYYAPIAWCLEHGLRRFEAGAQGEHKLKRGLLPNACYSSHWIRDASLAAAIAAFLPQEEAAVGQEMAILDGHAPFRRE